MADLNINITFVQINHQYQIVNNNTNRKEYNSSINLKFKEMKQIKVKSQGKVTTFNLPTSIDEISNDFLTKVGESIEIAEHYTLVGIVCYNKINDLVLIGKNNSKSSNIGVIPIFVKGGELQNIMDVKVGQKLLITSNNIELGVRVAVPNNPLNLSRFINNISSRVKGLYPELEYDDEKNENVYFIEFKLIPNCNIQGVYNEAPNFDEFKYIEVNNE